MYPNIPVWFYAILRFNETHVTTRHPSFGTFLLGRYAQNYNKIEKNKCWSLGAEEQGAAVVEFFSLKILKTAVSRQHGY